PFKKESYMTAQENLSKLKKTSLLMNFVKKNNGTWEHPQWQELCDTIRSKGYNPIDFDQVGVLLEEKKAKFHNS
ncbi:MAG: hypothetical protein PQJ60_10135, partial [Spirochaetales bacterium]|nr:hypothetical protein [Spirochaetales bacterium]